jgi:hypothetical protein
MTNPSPRESLNYALRMGTGRSHCGIISLSIGASATLLQVANTLFWHTVAIPAMTPFVTDPTLPPRIHLIATALAVTTAALLIVGCIYGILGILPGPRRRVAAAAGLLFSIVPIPMQLIDSSLFHFIFS